MHVILDAREYGALDPESPAKYGASEPLVLRMVKAMTDAGHHVDAVYSGDEEKFVDGVVWWPWNKHPTKCDVLIECEWLIHASEFQFDRLYVPLNKNNPILDNHESEVTGFVVFNEEHKRQLLLYNTTIDPKKVVINGVGVEPGVAAEKRPHNIIWCHTPERGLVHIARQWPEILKHVPDATLTMTYGLERSWDGNKWLMDTIAEYLAECIDWKAKYADSIIDLGRSTKAQVKQAQAEAEIMSYPCDAPLPGIFTAFAVMECAAAGDALLLPKLEGLPEEFDSIGHMLDIPIVEQEWVEETVKLLLDDDRKAEMAEAGRAWATTRTWEDWAKRWQEMVE